MKFIGVLAVVSVVGSPQSATTEDEIIVEVDSARGVATYLQIIGFYDIDNHPERLRAVPRTRILRVPMSTTKVWRENVSLRKSVFFRLGLSAVLQVNEEILNRRERLLSLSMSNLSAADRAWLSKMMERYGVGKMGAPITPKRLAELTLRLDALPPSLVMVQGAIESGWLQSRFARKGQAVFGQWTNSESGIKALDSEVRLAAFSNPRESLTAYMLNLNTHSAYTKLRKARAELRRDGKPIDGYTLAEIVASFERIRRQFERQAVGRVVVGGHNEGAG